MVNKCSAVGCKSGYTSATTADSVTFHSFPLNNPSLLEKWKKSIPNQNLVPTKYMRMCSLHFSEQDFVTTSQDSCASWRKRNSSVLEKRYLKPGAVPTIFPNAPKYPSTTRQPAQSTCSATSSARLDLDNMRLQSEIGDFFAENSILDGTPLQEIQELLDAEENRPAGFQTSICDGRLCIYMLDVKPVCRIACSICIESDRKVSISINGSPISKDKVIDFAGKEGRVSTISGLLNLMGKVKNWKESTDV